MLGGAAGILGGGVAHADDGTGKSAPNATSDSRAATPRKAASATEVRMGVGHSKRPPRISTQQAAASPYTGRSPNRQLDALLLTIWQISTKIPGLNPATPPPMVTRNLAVDRSVVDGMPVYTLRPQASTSSREIVAIHGGAYVGQIGLINWITYSDIARDTGATVVVPVYPLAPDSTAVEVVPKIARLITQGISTRGADNVSVLGVSAGGGLALAAVQQLVLTGAATPRRMVLVAPWLDATVADPASLTIHDQLLTVSALRQDGLLWAGQLDPSDPRVSPINGSLHGLPTTYVWSGSADLLSPQTLRLRDITAAQGLTNFRFILRAGEVHGWVAFPFLPSAIRDRPELERQLVGG
jgi:acetyl esterase/lipase